MSTKKPTSYSEELRKKYGRINIGAFLSAWRTADDISQTAFAKKLGLSAANLCDFEQGRRISLNRCVLQNKENGSD